MIADLDAALAEAGEIVRLQRLAGTQQIKSEVSCVARMRGYSAQEVVGGVRQQDVRIIISPTQIDAAGWPGPGNVPASGDPRVPHDGDRIVTSRGPLRIVNAIPTYMQGRLVRIEIQARGLNG